MTFQAAFDTFKTALQESPKLDAVWDAFFDLSAHARFIEQSRPAPLQNLELMIGVCKIMLEDPTGDYRLPLVLQYADSGFYHGIIQGSRHMGSFLYLKSLDMGSIAMIANASQSTDFCRFRLAVVGGVGECGGVSDGGGPTLH